MAAEGSRVPSAAHAAGAFLARRPSQEPDDLAHGRQGGGQIAWQRTMRGVFCPYSRPRPRAPEKAPSENAWCYIGGPYLLS
jgi:hypothetical protein